MPSAALRVSEVDLADLRSVGSFTDRERRVGPLHVLVANAGVMLVPARQFTADGFEMHMGVNHIGHAALILGLLPVMSEGSAGRIVVVGSTAHWFTLRLDDDLGTTGPYTPMGAYANSKLAGTLFMCELDRRLGASGSRVRAVGAHPGWCATEVLDRDDHPGGMVRLSRWFTQALGSSPPQGARPLIAAASDPDLAGGSYLGPRWALRGAPHRLISARRPATVNRRGGCSKGPWN